MKSLNSIFARNKGMKGALIVAAAVVLAILVGAYIDLKMAFIPENTYEEAAASSTVPLVSNKHYQNTAYGYSFDHPLYLETGPNQNQATRYYDDMAEDSLFVGSLPKEYVKGTNLSAVSLIAGAKSGSKTCDAKSGGNKIASSSGRIPMTTITLNDITYTVVSTSDAAMGSAETTTRYSTMHNGLCYSISIVAHSFNDIDGHNRENPNDIVKMYDQDALDRVLDEVMQSFAFTK